MNPALGFKSNLLSSSLHHKQSFQSYTSNDIMFNYSLEPVISEEDAQLENDVPIVQLVDIEHFTPSLSKANKLKQIDNHNLFV